MNCAIGSGALAFATFVPVDRYEPTIATSTESASASSRAKFGAGSSGIDQLRPQRRDRRGEARR